jgi:hypothetical protein
MYKKWFFLHLFFLCITFSLTSCQSAVYTRRTPPPTPIDPHKGAAVLEQFRNQRLHGDFCFLFELRTMESGEVYTGQIWGTWNEQGPLTRISVMEKIDGDPSPHPKPLVSLLIQNGTNPKIWKYAINLTPEGLKKGNQTPCQLTTQEFFEPILPGIELTAFDLQMPFIYWENYHYKGSDNNKGTRKKHIFLMYPPPGIIPKFINLRAIRLFLDYQFNAMTKAELLDNKGVPIKIFKIRSLKKLNGQYIVKKIDFFNEKPRTKIRFTVKAACLNLKLSPSIFLPKTLNKLPPTIPFENFEWIK